MFASPGPLITRSTETRRGLRPLRSKERRASVNSSLLIEPLPSVSHCLKYLSIFSGEPWESKASCSRSHSSNSIWSAVRGEYSACPPSEGKHV